MDYLSFLLPLVLPQLYQTGGSSHNLLGIVVPPVFSTTANESLRPVLSRLPPSCNSNYFGYKLIEIGIDKSVAQISANQAV